VARLMAEHPEVAAIGGRGEAVCEVAPPPWFDRYQGCYAVGPQGPECGLVTELWTTFWTAGMSLRRSAWDQLVDHGFRFRLAGRQGAALTGGEDTELCYALRLAGWKLWYEPRLHYRHFLPERRLHWSYLRRMHRGCGADTVGLDPYEFAISQNGSHPKETLRRTWPWQTMRTLRKLARYQHKLIRWSRSPLEGDHDAILLERLVGRLQALLRQAQTYDRSVREVLQAPWAQPLHIGKSRLATMDTEGAVEQVGAV
jgi:hypothetical protein